MISIIICTYNPKPIYLERTIHAVLQQQFQKSEMEFFIVDNNSTTPVQELTVVREHNIKVIIERTPGLTAARECAVRHAAGEIIVFVDDDNILDPLYVQTVSEVFRNPQIGVVSGNVEPEYEQHPADWFLRFAPMLALRKIESSHLFLTSIPFYNDYFPIGAGMCIRTQLLKEYFQSINDSNRIEGRVGTSLSSGEDLDIDFFAISKGYVVGATGALKLLHIIPPQRCEVDYIRRLAVSSLHSSYLINKKWKPVFGSNVFSFFAISRVKILFKIILYSLTPWKKSSSVLFHFHKKLLSVMSASNHSV